MMMLRAFSRLPLSRSAMHIRQSLCTAAKPGAAKPHSFLSGVNSNVLETMYQAWQEDPNSVDESWHNEFRAIQSDIAELNADQSVTVEGQQFSINETLNILKMSRAYRTRGHLVADLDPLKLPVSTTTVGHTDLVELRKELDYKSYGFTEADLEREFYVRGDFPSGEPVMKLSKIISILQKAYTSTVGIEYRHLLPKESKDWIQTHVEHPDFLKVSKEEKGFILRELAKSELFERFLAKYHPAVKRFGLEGGEATIVGMQALLNRGAEQGLESVVIGMAHRGRLNVLGNVVHKPLEVIFREFEATQDENSVEGTGDVKYHMGTSSKVKLHNGKEINLSLTANPSHLEAVNPVVVGKTRAKQDYHKDTKRSRVMGLMVHGDAAFAGQGVVPETLALSDLKDYTVGGCVHIVTNNQIGFTTDPRSARSSPYCSDVAKMIGAPIFHVNGDDVEAVYRVCNLAMDYRMRFQDDVVVDIFCYRRHGHNEGDEARFTQPIMYKHIDKQPFVLSVYRDQLLKEKVISEEEFNTVRDEVNNNFEAAYKLAKQPEKGRRQQEEREDWLENQWVAVKSMWCRQPAKTFPTAVPEAELKAVGEAITPLPEGYAAHNAVARNYRNRATMIATGKGIDWGFAEALAFGTLVKEGFIVRLSGQDCERGTFSHRHAVLHDQETEERYIPIHKIENGAELFTVCNSNLSEFGVMGFELGYSLEHPKSLVIWEAQFGDFVNGAQVIIDNFLSSGEQKWLRQTGLTLLLPHGYDGQGPEHSSARLERFLQGVDEDSDIFPEGDALVRQEHRVNMQVVNLTTPANYFHCLRRQLKREWRKPLVVMAPKSLLRHPECKSDLEEFTNGEFLRTIPETSTDLVPDNEISRVVFCTGKIYYELRKMREDSKLDNVAIVRVEQLAPFPFDEVEEQVARYPNATVVWCQEEPKNMGAWSYVYFRFLTVFRHLGVTPNFSYATRKPYASPAAGTKRKHDRQQKRLTEIALGIAPNQS